MLKKIDAIELGAFTVGIYEDDRIYGGLSLNDGYQYAWTCTCGQEQGEFKSRLQMEISVGWHRKSHEAPSE